MIKEAYWADCTIDRSKEGNYSIYCTFQSNGKIIDADYQGTDFVKGVNHILDSIEKQLKPEPKIDSKDEMLAKLKEENEKLKAQLNSFTAIENTFEKKLQQQLQQPKKQEKTTSESKSKEKKNTSFNNAYDAYFKTVDDLTKKWEEKTKNMTDEEYLNYIYSLFDFNKK